MSRREVKRLYRLLDRKEYYSLELNYTSEETGIPVEILESLANGSYFNEITGDKLNIFSFGRHTFIGLESRRIAYDEDEAKGKNWVTEAIKKGVYD